MHTKQHEDESTYGDTSINQLEQLADKIIEVTILQATSVSTQPSSSGIEGLQLPIVLLSKIKLFVSPYMVIEILGLVCFSSPLDMFTSWLQGCFLKQQTKTLQQTSCSDCSPRYCSTSRNGVITFKK